MYKRIFPQLLLVAISLFSFNSVTAQETLPQLVRRLKPMVVAIATYDADGEPLMTGSGFFLRPGEVVTNLHVIRGAKRVEIKTLDGKGKVFPVKGTTALDEEGDLALLSVDTPPERSRESQLARVLPDEGESIFVIGNPLKLEGSVSDGIVSAVREVPSVGKIIQITAPTSHGNSGSPVFNDAWEVVALHHSGVPRTDDQGRPLRRDGRDGDLARRVQVAGEVPGARAAGDRPRVGLLHARRSGG